MRPAPNPLVVEWLRDNEPDLAVNPIVLGEIEYGILLLAEGRQRRQLREWFANKVRGLAILDFDAATATIWAQLLADLRRKATPMPVKDSLIAASAIKHGLAVATRNVADFAKANVKIINPFEA